MAEHSIRVLDSSMSYVEMGAGTPIVFLHGNPVSSYLWRNVMPAFAATNRCLAPDLIGMGKSGKPDLDYSFADHARYLDAWFDALKIDQVTLVIHDWGSALGIHWAKRNPGRVTGIAMSEAIIREWEWSEWSDDFANLFRAFRTPGVGEKLILEENVFIEKVLPGATIRKLTDEEMNVYRAPYPDARSRRPMLAWPRQLPFKGEVPAISKMIAENLAYLTTSDTPKLLLTFEPGILITPAVAEWAGKTLKNVEVKKIGPGLHYVQEDHPDAIAAAVRDWRARTGQK